MGNDKKISFRLPTEQYYSLYRTYEKYQIHVPNLTFSDFIRNILLSLSIKIDENENKTNDIEHKL